jgi:hypothetical protein
MAFHETYWVITGSAAPVLGLAAVLSIGDVTRLVSVHREWLGRQVLSLVDSKTLARTDVAMMRLRAAKHGRRHGSYAITWSVIIYRPLPKPKPTRTPSPPSASPTPSMSKTAPAS